MNNQQKHVLCIIFDKGKFEHTSELFKSISIKILNVVKLKIFNNAVFIYLFIYFITSTEKLHCRRNINILIIQYNTNIVIK